MVSKGATILIHLLALPVILRSLGTERFGVYALFGSGLAFVLFSQAGCGTFLIREAARTTADGNFGRLRYTWQTATALTVLLSVLAAAAFVGLKTLGLLESLFPENVTSDVVALGFVSAWLIGTVIAVSDLGTKVQVGFQEAHFGNLYGAAGNCGVVIAVLLVALIGPGEVSFVVAAYGPIALAAALSVGHFMHRHPQLRHAPVDPSGGLARVVRQSGLYFTIQTLLPFVQREVPKIGFAAENLISATGYYAVFMQLSTFGIGAIIMFTHPFYAAAAEAWERGDTQWISKRWRLACKAALAIAAALLVLMPAVGPAVFRLWLGADFVVEPITAAAFAFFLSVQIWTHIQVITLLALGQVRIAAALAIAEAGILALAFSLASFHSVTVILFLIGGVHAVLSGSAAYIWTGKTLTKK